MDVEFGFVGEASSAEDSAPERRQGNFEAHASLRQGHVVSAVNGQPVPQVFVGTGDADGAPSIYAELCLGRIQAVLIEYLFLLVNAPHLPPG